MSKAISDRTPGSYRPEIDGLRAIAVMSVILCHTSTGILPAGYLGVDVFFVISGFLITGIIEREILTHTFSIRKFYERRLRRIIPALYVMMLLCVPLSCALMLPDDLENFGQSLVGTVLFSNNIVLWKTSDYFALETAFKPLAHTWSLGVEEQYYIIAPLLIWLGFAQRGRVGVAVCLGLFATISFAFCLWASQNAQEANFYLLPSRAWELCAGGLAALGERRIRGLFSSNLARQIMVSFGLLAIVLPMIFLGEDASLPNAFTLIPVAGTCILLALGDPKVGVGRGLSLRPFVLIGLISYSAYLYHQPVFAFVRIASLAQPPGWLMLSLIVPIIGLAYLSWRFIEKPFRQTENVKLRPLIASSLVASLAILGAGASMHLTSGFQFLRSELRGTDPNYGANQNISFNLAPRKFIGAALPPRGGGTNVLVIGNSFARDFINMGLETHKLDSSRLSYSPDNICKPLPPAAAEAAKNADLIVAAGNFLPEDVSCIASGFKALSAQYPNAKLYVLGTKGFGWNNNAIMLLPKETRYKYRVHPLREVIEANRLARDSLGENYIDMLSMISDDEGKVPVFTPDHKFISQDRRHLTQAGAAYIGGIVFSAPAFASLSADSVPRRRG